jgi:hypothetical protein
MCEVCRPMTSPQRRPVKAKSRTRTNSDSPPSSSFKTLRAHPISSVDEPRSDACEADGELDEFLAFVAASRHAEAWGYQVLADDGIFGGSGTCCLVQVQK